MKVRAGVLTWNPIDNRRLNLLEQAVASLNTQCDVTVFDNGSTDGFETGGHIHAATTHFARVKGFPHGNTCGYGMNKIAATLDADILIMSNDDIIWQPDTVKRLEAMWAAAPDDLTIISGLVEPTFALPDTEPWNKPYGTADLAGEKLLLRKSVPGGAWTFRSADKPLIFPVSTFPGVDDVPACHRLISQRHGVAAVNLADHAGVGQSTWGNASHERFIVEPLTDLKARFDL